MKWPHASARSAAISGGERDRHASGRNATPAYFNIGACRMPFYCILAAAKSAMLKQWRS